MLKESAAILKELVPGPQLQTLQELSNSYRNAIEKHEIDQYALSWVVRSAEKAPFYKRENEENYYEFPVSSYHAYLYSVVPRYFESHSRTALTLWNTLIGADFDGYDSEVLKVSIPVHRKIFEKGRLSLGGSTDFKIHRNCEVSFLTLDEARRFAKAVFPFYDKAGKFEVFLKEEMEKNKEKYLVGYGGRDLETRITEEIEIFRGQSRFIEVIYRMAKSVRESEGRELLIYRHG